MELGKKPAEHIIPSENEWEGRLISNSTLWWVKSGWSDKTRLYCIHNVALTADCEECAQKT